MAPITVRRNLHSTVPQCMETRARHDKGMMFQKEIAQEEEEMVRETYRREDGLKNRINAKG